MSFSYYYSIVFSKIDNLNKTIVVTFVRKHICISFMLLNKCSLYTIPESVTIDNSSYTSITKVAVN